MEPQQLSAKLARRIRVIGGNHPSPVSQCRHSVLPVIGYTNWMEAMIGGIPCLRGVDYLQQRDQFQVRKQLVLTGSLDEFFGFDEGRLAYRSQLRRQVFHTDRNSIQPCRQVNYSDACESAPLRTIEWKYSLLPEQQRHVAGTVVTEEYPCSPSEPDAFEYPFPDSRNEALGRRYRVRAARTPNLLICGRLGEYRYYDMDHAIDRAFTLADRILDQDS
ncbi:MAG: UDP-galactopyranose mutase [Verrucomicrobiota bacterium]